ncbi:DUF4292 domain-containing protein [Lacinutrix salivirga]
MTLPKYSKYAVLLILLLAFGCKGTKSVVSNGELNSNLSTKQLLKNSTKNNAKFKTLAARLKIAVTQKDNSQSYTVSMRMEKDKAIWMSKLGIVKALITPNRVAFYNKLDNTYFDGDFSYLSDLLGTDLDFEKVQNMLLGEALYELNDKDYKLSTHENSYLLQPKQQNQLFEIFFLMNPSHFKMDSQQIEQRSESRFLQIDYLNYQTVGTQILPQETKIIAIENLDQTTIELELKNVELNKSLRFPFTIPSGYDEIELK